MNFELNDDQQAYIASAKAFSEKELAPHAAYWDAESVFAKEALRAAGELGFMGMYTPEAAGGAGYGTSGCQPDRGRAREGMHHHRRVSDDSQYGHRHDR